jgi:hypothetical protein
LSFHDFRFLIFNFFNFLDPPRQEYFWVNDFTEEEANRYLDKLGFTQDKNIRKFVFEKYGTRPSFLRDIAGSTLKPEEFIENYIKENEDSVKDCLKADKNNFLKKLFQKLLQNENKNGIESLHVDEESKIIAEGPAVKGYHVLAYVIEKEYLNFIPIQCVKQQEDLLKPTNLI